MNLPLKVGFVGKRGEGALQCFRVMPETEVAAFCTRHEETVRPIADRYNIPQAYTRFEDLLGSDVDIIFVGSPLPDHVTQSTTYRLKPVVHSGTLDPTDGNQLQRGRVRPRHETPPL